MRRSLSGAAVAASTLALSLVPQAAHAEGAPWMFLSDVRPGMQCTASSVIQGLEPTTFDATVVAVSGGPRPADAIILVRFSGDAIKDTGVGQGFSGTPVTCPGPDGVPRVIGALALGIGQYDTFVVGVTPIEAMLATPTFAEAPSAPAVGEPSATTPSAATSKKTTSTTKKPSTKKTTAKAKRAAAANPSAQMPLQLSGPRGGLATAIKAAADKAKFPLLIAPSAKRLQAPAGGLKPGDAVAATTVSGDVSAGAVGTVTYVDGNRVWAFGHSFNGTGPSRLTMERAQIDTVIASPAIGDQVTYKLGSGVGAVGTIGFDGAFGIGGVLGAAPPAIPVTTTVKNAAGAVVQQAQAFVTDERAVRGGTTGGLLPLAAAANAGTALQRLTTQAAVGGATRTCTRVLLKNGQKPLEECVDAVVAEPDAQGGVETGVADAVAGAVSGVVSAERYLRLVDRVQVDVTLRNEADTIEIVRVKQPKSVRAGKTATVRVVVVQGSSGERREIPVKVKIPSYAAGQRTGIVILSGPAASSSADLFEELFVDESDAPSAPKTLDALRAQYTRDGLSGLRAAVIPGVSGANALELLTGDSEESELSEEELEALTDQVKLVQELPTFLLEGAASTSVRPR